MDPVPSDKVVLYRTGFFCFVVVGFFGMCLKVMPC